MKTSAATYRNIATTLRTISWVNFWMTVLKKNTWGKLLWMVQIRFSNIDYYFGNSVTIKNNLFLRNNKAVYFKSKLPWISNWRWRCITWYDKMELITLKFEKRKTKCSNLRNEGRVSSPLPNIFENFKFQIWMFELS